MPLVRRSPATQAADAAIPDAAQARAALATGNPAQRRAAARILGEGQDPAPLAQALGTDRDPGVRDAIFAALLRMRAAGCLCDLLRSDDAGLRSAAGDALQAMPDAVLPLLPALLADADPDMRILAAGLARSLRPADANRLLCAALPLERHANVAAAQIEVLAETGTAEAIAVLREAAVRFAADPFLPFAVAAAIRRVGDGPA